MDYKIASKALANRFTQFLPRLINEGQVGYVKGRDIADNIRIVSDILAYLKDNNMPGIIVNIDFEKFLKAVLDKFNFGPSFKKWVVINTIP